MEKKRILLVASFLLCNICLFAQNDNGQQSPPRRREFRFDNTNPDVHDPVIAYEDSTFYIFSTGFNVGIMSSTDLVNWYPQKSALPESPIWAQNLIQGYRGHTWAPDIINVDGLWYLYYSCSTFGRNTSAIGVAVNKTLNPDSPEYEWKDLGLVINSVRGDDYNCIDPNLVIDKEGRPWLTFGSFWDGIQLVQLQSDMKTPIGKPVTIARHTNPEAVPEEGIEANNNEIEAPFIIRQGKYYYLFASAGLCCRGLRSTYHTIVGRSKNIEGPYVDKKGKQLLKGGGTLLIGRDDKYAGVGHNGLACINGQWIFVAHGYDIALNGRSKLVIKKMKFKKGWPVLEDL